MVWVLRMMPKMSGMIFGKTKNTLGSDIIETIVTTILQTNLNLNHGHKSLMINVYRDDLGEMIIMMMTKGNVEEMIMMTRNKRILMTTTSLSSDNTIS